MKKVQKIGIMDPSATVPGTCISTIADSLLRKSIVLCSLNTLNPLVELTPPIPTGGQYSVTVLTPKIERTQIMAIGMTDETIVAGARYGVQIGNHTIKDKSEFIQPSKYAYTAPTILSGSADTDRYNVYASLAGKINSYTDNHVTAYVLHKVPYTAGQSTTGVLGGGADLSPLTADYANTGLPNANKVMVGSAGLQAVTGYTMNIAALTYTGGTVTATTLAGTVWIYNLIDPATGIYPVGGINAANAITFATAVPMSIAAEDLVLTPTFAGFEAGQGMAIVDDAGYFTPNTYPGRTGKSEVQLYGDWVTSTTISEARVGYYARGIGSNLLAKVPQYGLVGHDSFIRGDMDYELYRPGGIVSNGQTFVGTFDATHIYSKVIINVVLPVSISSMSNELNGIETQYVHYIENGAVYNAEEGDVAIITALWVTNLTGVGTCSAKNVIVL